jgi:hypothetical protein
MIESPDNASPDPGRSTNYLKSAIPVVLLTAHFYLAIVFFQPYAAVPIVLDWIRAAASPLSGWRGDIMRTRLTL